MVINVNIIKQQKHYKGKLSKNPYAEELCYRSEKAIEKDILPI